MIKVDCQGLRVRLKDDVRPLLRAWELDQALQRGRREIRFEFQRANVVDRKPDPGGVSMIALKGVVSLEAIGSATLTLSMRRYPPPPTGSIASADVETLWNRYEGSRLGREPLPSMGYFCFTAIKWVYGGREGTASRALKISGAVLRTLRQLTSERGDAATARKHTGTAFQALTRIEAKWIDEAVRVMIRRFAMDAAGQPPTVDYLCAIILAI